MNKELKEYVESEIARGVGKQEIRDTLLQQGGWTEEDFGDLFEDLVVTGEIKTGFGEGDQIITENKDVYNPQQVAESKFKPYLLGAIVAVLLFALAGGVFFVKQQKNSSGLMENGSPEYMENKKGIDALNEEWSKLEAELRADGKSDEEIKLYKSDYFEFIATALLLDIKLNTALTDSEKDNLLGHVEEIVDADVITKPDRGCKYSEEILPVEDFFEGAVIKFSNPMLYITDPDDQEKCSPIMKQKDYELYSADSWNSIIFDKSEIKELPIDEGTTFTVEGKILLELGGLFDDETVRYVLRDSKGNLSVPSFFIFDMARSDDKSSSYLYKDDEQVGHLVQDIRGSVVWLEENGVPEEVVESYDLQRPSSFESPLLKRGEFLRRLMFAVQEDKLINYSQKELIDAGLTENIYEIQGSKIVNDYGGAVEVTNDGTHVAVAFSGVPRGDDCYKFYFMNDPDIYGFNETYIDGTLKEYIERSSQGTSAFKEKVCFTEKDVHEITFKGSVSEIISQAQSIQRRESNPYR